MATQSELLGYSLPLSPQGRASLVAGPPWHFYGRILYISFKTDPDEVRKWLPAPFELGPDPELASVMFCEWNSVPFSDPEFAGRHPERSHYHEAVLMVGCNLNGRAGQRCPAIWVDNDFTLVRGWLQGYPKKMARIHIARPAECGPPQLNACRLEEGGIVSATCESAGERLITGSVKMKEKASLDDLPPLMRRPIYLTRHFPSLQPGELPLVHDVITLASEKPDFGAIWKGDADLQFGDAFFEEHTTLKPREIIGGYHISMAYSIKGAKVLHRYPTAT